MLLANEDVRIAWFVATTDSELYRDATGDQLVYVQSGHGVLESSFGAIAVGPGDYVSVPCADDPPLARQHPTTRSPRSCSKRAATCACRAST